MDLSDGGVRNEDPGAGGYAMFTWNFQFVSKAKLAETFNQLMLEREKGDILIRIHTAIHKGDEAVELAAFIKSLAPKARIFGTSTSAVISGGRLLHDQCVISVTRMNEGKIKSARIDFKDPESGLLLSPDILCRKIDEEVLRDDTKMMLCFVTGKYGDVYDFVETTNDYFPGVQMIGGVANAPAIAVDSFSESGFVFDETGWSEDSLMVASISGRRVESVSSYATGACVIGDEMEVTKTDGAKVLAIDGVPAPEKFREDIGDDVREHPELAILFPYVYAGTDDVPVLMLYSEDFLSANHNVTAGKRIKRAFIYDRKMVSDNRTLFEKVENFEKAETIFGYSCTARSMIYSNCVKWELSIYENSNMCGCITEGEFVWANGRNTFANCAFSVSAVGEAPTVQQYNPYVLSHTATLKTDNRKLIDYLTVMEDRLEREENYAVADRLKEFISKFESKILYAEEEFLNEAALNMDISLRGYDRICVINVLDTTGMRLVFSDQMIAATRKNYMNKCAKFAQSKRYRFYLLDRWEIVIAAPSYMVSLYNFSKDMRELQKELSRFTEEDIAIVPVFCVLNDCRVESVRNVYSAARVEMMKKNVQFHVHSMRESNPDAEIMRERYHMVNVINYALSHDKVIPHYQGIYDSKENTIRHYESLMRLEDESGRIYYPGEFLDVARAYGLLYDSLSITMIRKVFERFKDIEDRSVSINLSMRDIKNEEIINYIYDFLSTVAHPGNFVFEILENEDVDDYNSLVRFVDNIHRYGGLISIDDFGAGYSNLQHLTSIHSDYIKIDGSIVRNCCNDSESEKLVALIMGWKDLSDRDIRVVAEFVENEEICNKLKLYNVDCLQGYYFSRPSTEIK